MGFNFSGTAVQPASTTQQGIVKMSVAPATPGNPIAVGDNDPRLSGSGPAGSNKQVQFNNSGSFGADSNFNWDSTNHRLGLGTATPSTTLELINLGTNTATINVHNTASNGDTSIFFTHTTGQTEVGTGISAFGGGFEVYDRTNAASRIFVAATGNVGIHQTSPASTLDVNGTATATLFSGPVTALKSATTSVVVSSATAPTAGQVLTATSGTAADWQTPSGGGGTPAGSDTWVQYNSAGSFGASPNFTWNNSGQTLNVVNTVATTNVEGGSTNGVTVFCDVPGSYANGANVAITAGQSGDGGPSNAGGVTISGGFNSDPGAGGNGGLVLIQAGHSSNGTDGTISFGIVGAAQYAGFDHTGKLGLGNTSPSYQVDVTGDANVSGVYRVSGTAGFTGTGAYTNFTIHGGIITAAS